MERFQVLLPQAQHHRILSEYAFSASLFQNASTQ